MSSLWVSLSSDLQTFRPLISFTLAPPPPPFSFMNLQRYLFLFLRYLWLILLLVAASLAGAWVWLGKQTPVYASQAVIEVVSDQAQVLDTIKDVKDSRITGLDALNTVVQSLTSNTMMLAVANSTGRAAEWAAKSSNGKVTPDMESSLAASIRAQLSVSLRKGTRLIDIVAEDSSPEKARDLAAKVTEEFMATQAQDRTDVGKDANSFLVNEANKLKKKLEESETKLARYRLDTKAVSLKDNQNIVNDRLAQLNNQVTDAAGKRAAVETDLEALKKVDLNDLEGLLRLPSVAALPEISTLRAALAARESEFVALKERYLELHPKYIAASTELEEFRKKLRTAIASAGETLRQQFNSFVETESKIKALLAEQEKKALEMDEISIPYNVLQREVQTDRALYEAILTRLKETNVTQGLSKNPYRINGEPLINLRPVRPNKSKTMLLAGIIALGLSAGFILVMDRMDSSVRTVDEAEAEFNLPVLAAVPEGPVGKIDVGGTVMTDAPDSAQAEAFRNLRASISLMGDEKHRRLLLVTSAIPSEGKTFCSTNLAAALAGQGLRTLIIDADLRRPALSASLLPPDERRGDHYRGLTDVLSGLCDVKEAVRPTTVHGLSLLPSGRRAPNPSELLAQHDIPALLDKLLEQYDRVVIDSAPINAVSDTLGLAPHVHAICVVLMFGKTPRRAIQRAINLLQKGGARIAGLVMNRMPANKGAAYYYYYYGDPYTKDSVYGADKASSKSRRKMPK
jgi:polysaccharide biosynthesis transport protein